MRSFLCSVSSVSISMILYLQLLGCQSPVPSYFFYIYVARRSSLCTVCHLNYDLLPVLIARVQCLRSFLSNLLYFVCDPYVNGDDVTSVEDDERDEVPIAFIGRVFYTLHQMLNTTSQSLSHRNILSIIRFTKS